MTNGYTYTGNQPGADGDFDLAHLWNHGGGTAVTHHGDGLPGGSDGKPGRDGRDRRDRSEQHDDHSDHSGACRGRGQCSGDQHGCPERHPDQRLHLHHQHGGRTDRVRAGEYGHAVGTAQASVAVTYPLAQTAGNLNVVAVGWNDTTSTVSSVSDSRGNTYTQAGARRRARRMRQSIYYAKNIAGGSNTVTVTFNQAAAFVDVRVLEYSGLDTSNPLDVTAGAAGTGRGRTAERRPRRRPTS